MILKRLYELAEREGLLQDPAFNDKPVTCLIQIGEQGEFRGILDLRDRREEPSRTTGGKPKVMIDDGKPISVPVFPVMLEIPKVRKKKNAIAAEPRWKTTRPSTTGTEKPAVFLADTIARVLPVQGLIKDKDRSKNDAQRATFWRFVDHVASATDDPALRSLQRFGEWLKTNDKAAETLTNEIQAKALPVSRLCTFAWLTDEVIGRPIVLRPSVRDWWRMFYAVDQATQASDATRRWCQVTEVEAPLAKTIKIRINGLTTIGCRADAYLVTSFEASESYNFQGTTSSMVSENGVDGFTRALNALIANALPGRPKTSIVRGWGGEGKRKGFAFLFWTREKSDVSSLMEIYTPHTEEVERLIRGADVGRPVYGTDVRDFFCVSMTNNLSRVVIRDYLETSLPRIETSFGRWFRDLRIIDEFNCEVIASFPIGKLSNATARDSDDVRPELPTTLLLSALRESPIPLPILGDCLRRMRVETGPEQFRVERVALIKLILNRSFSKGELPMTAELDRDRTADRAYVCGRLFACLAYLQAFERNPEKHGFGQEAAMLSGFYGSASATPRSVFGTLMRHTQHRLNKLKDEFGSFVNNRVKELEELTEHLGCASAWQADFPPVLSLTEQGRFALGFYHQRAEYRRASAEWKAAHAKSPESPNVSPQ